MSSSEHLHELPDPERRKLLQQATAATGGLALAAASYPFVASLLPSERARAQGAPVEADVSALLPGALATVEWRGKPVWVLRRTPEMPSNLESIRGALTDPDSLQPGWPGGFYCSCRRVLQFGRSSDRTTAADVRDAARAIPVNFARPWLSQSKP